MSKTGYAYAKTFVNKQELMRLFLSLLRIEYVHIVVVSEVKLISNLTHERKFILQFLGSACQKYYLLC